MTGSFEHIMDCRQPGALAAGLRALEHCQAYALLPPPLRFVADLIVDELASNAIKYGGPDCLEVGFQLDFDGHLMRVAVMDDGPPFNPWQDAPSVDSPSTPTASLKIGGRGIHMIRHATDSQHYERRNAKNISTLTRRWNPNPQDATAPTTGPRTS
ncbi:MAG: ATP-binding protein [Verrucomicrobiales bacterium]